MCRCKACDDVMEEGEIIWRTHLHMWEDLCAICRNIVDIYEVSYRAKLDKINEDRFTISEDSDNVETL